MTKPTIETIFTQLDTTLKEGNDYTKTDVLQLLKEFTSEKTKAPRAKTSYQFFMGDAEVRSSITDSNKDATSKDILKLMADHWATLSDSDKEKYVQLSDLDKAKVQQLQGPKTEKVRTRFKIFYQFFMGDSDIRQLVKDENTDANNKDILKLMSVKWNTLTDSEKKKYEEMSEQDKLLFTKTPFDLFKEGLSEDEVQGAQAKWDALTDSERDAFSEKKKTPEKKSAKASKSPLKFYQSDNNAKTALKLLHPDAKAGEITKLLSEKWKTMTTEEQTPYKEMAEKLKLQNSLLTGGPRST